MIHRLMLVIALHLEGNLSDLIQSIHTNGYSSQLAWLSTYISDEAKDRELDSEWEELCVVPVEQSIAEALETELFSNLMVSLGLMPPSEQVQVSTLSLKIHCLYHNRKCTGGFHHHLVHKTCKE